jgi:hypothetical protein
MDELRQQSCEFAESLAEENASVPKTYILKVDDFDRANVTFDGKEYIVVSNTCCLKSLQGLSEDESYADPTCS